ncbi:pyridoxal phosphate-dependent aminotransferase [Rhodobaculum claviforme]|uniref:aspartate transaminase n=1 Tax=Rhodobaculum claviforme TaxID=1549854 RepID=A0A934TMI0_9RHOB|nr:pyridoxal phosphate-dependent aminotransferase [Rhodobaculum claviforme]MBK5928597.1 aminotransferase [Rhodobaculum claviforme]
MRYASITGRLADLGGAKWAVHNRAVTRQRAGDRILMLTIGEPDVPTPEPLLHAAITAMRDGRTGYSNGRGEPALLRALAARYSARVGRPVTEDQVLCFPGTQTALYAVLSGVAEQGCEVLVGDPMYATYEGVIRAGGAAPVPVPLRADAGFRLRPADVAARITPRTRAILLNTPHNPTGAVLGRDDLAAILDLAHAHDLWVISDEVYEDLVFGPTPFVSPMSLPGAEARVVVCSSISKSHAAAGFRSGWCVGPAAFCARLLPLAETMLFGNQPFIADMTVAALEAPDLAAAGMRRRLARRTALLADRLDGVAGLRLHRPGAGMFALLDVSGTGMDGSRFADALLDAQGVAVMPGASFGPTLRDWVRIALTRDDAVLAEAADRMATLAASRPAAE